MDVVSDPHYRVVFEHAPAPIALCTLDGRFVHVNRAFRSAVPGAGPDRSHRRLEHLARLVSRFGEGGSLAPGVNLPGWIRGLRDLRAGTREVVRTVLPLVDPAGRTRWFELATVRVDVGTGQLLLTHLDDVTLRREEEQRLTRLALRDGLTGLANRVLLADRLDAALARARRSRVPAGVLYLDLDGFKKVNDRLGHDAGDALLVVTAERLASALRAGDTAARIGGDEFVVVADGVGHEDALWEIGRRVERALTRPVALEGRPVPFGVSIGGVLSRDGEDSETLLRRADAAMYTVKRARRRSGRRGPAPQPVGQLSLLQDQVTVLSLERSVPEPVAR